MNERLIDFHLGRLGASERAELEEALLSSPAALREYLALKRAFDAGAGATLVPSAAIRARVRAAVLPRRVPRVLYPAVLALAMGAALAVFLGREPARPAGVPIDAAGSTSLSAEIL
jgi:hypothetical protein